jgi:hypothetical protein
MMSVSKFVLLSISSAALLLLGASQAAALNSIELAPATDSVNVGEQISIPLIMNFTESTVGGGFELSYVSAQVSFSSFAWNDSLWLDANLLSAFPQVAIPTDPAAPMTFRFGFFAMGTTPFGISGQNLLVGTMVFDALTPGTSMITTAYSSSQPGPFYGVTAPFPELVVNFGSTQITVNSAPATVPEPSTALLFLVGLAGLSCRSVRKN